MAAFTSTRLNDAQQNLRVMRNAGFRVSDATVAVLCAVSNAYLSNAFRGLTRAPHDVEQRIVESVSLLKDLSDAIFPLTLPTDANSLGKILNFMKANEISAGQIFLAVSSLFGDFRKSENHE
jgi:hypothetical protein